LSWLLRLAGLALVGCASAPPPVLYPVDWKGQPPAAACEAHASGVNQLIQQRRYDADGRLIFGMTTPHSNTRASEWFTWRGDKLVAVDSYLEADSSACALCGYRPTWRMIHRAKLEWEGAHLAVVTESEIEYGRDELRQDPVWRLADHRTRETRYRYRGPWLESQGSSVRFEFEDGRPVRRRRKMGLIFWDGPVESWTWKDGRVATYLWNDYVERFDYDGNGRLIRQRTEEQKGIHATVVRTWDYDERGAIRRMVRQSVSDGQPRDERVEEYEYDAGREIAVSYDAHSDPPPAKVPWPVARGPWRHETRWVGDCAKVKEGPPPPNVLDIMNAAPCFESPGKLFRQCF
jgi:YD repeat-containing protein